MRANRIVLVGIALALSAVVQQGLSSEGDGNLRVLLPNSSEWTADPRFEVSVEIDGEQRTRKLSEGESTHWELGAAERHEDPNHQGDGAIHVNQNGQYELAFEEVTDHQQATVDLKTKTYELALESSSEALDLDKPITVEHGEQAKLDYSLDDLNQEVDLEFAVVEGDAEQISWDEQEREVHVEEITEDARIAIQPTHLVARGGDELFEFDGHRVHAFTDPGEANFELLDPGPTGEVEVLVLGGGGGGGAHRGGGGGAGELRLETLTLEQADAIAVEVGDGGIGGSDQQSGADGEASRFGDLTVLGGGGGGAQGHAGQDGGSGGGGGSQGPYPGGEATGEGLGHEGMRGDNNYSNVGSAGGGGGAGGTPPVDPEAENKDGYLYVFPDGGDGIDVSDQFGESVGVKGWLAAGGGGGTEGHEGSTVIPWDEQGIDRAHGGRGGGGDGGRDRTGWPTDDYNNDDAQSAGVDSTGSGGGGGNYLHGEGSKGGSGVVLVRYPLEP